MPAKKKYLTKSPWIRLSKILSGTLGGYALTLSFHAALTTIFPTTAVVITSFITAYLLWAVLLLMAFLMESAWKSWGIYIGLTIVFSGIFLAF